MPDSLVLPCINSCVCLTGKLLFTGNVRSLFFPFVSKRDPFTDLWGVNEIHLLPFMSKQDAFTFFLPGKLFMIFETHVGHTGQDFSRDLVGPRGASNCYIFNRRPTECCCGQIWHGVVEQEDTYSYIISTGTRKLELTTL